MRTANGEGMTGSPLSRSSDAALQERPSPNFILLWQSNGPGRHAVIPVDLAGGRRRRGVEGAWEIVGLYHDEDEAFDALETWRPGPSRADGQLVMAQLFGLSYGDFAVDGQTVVHVETAPAVTPSRGRRSRLGGLLCELHRYWAARA